MNRNNSSESQEPLPLFLELTDAHQFAEETNHPAGSKLRSELAELDDKKAELPKKVLEFLHDVALTEDALRSRKSLSRLRSHNTDISRGIIRLGIAGYNIKNALPDPSESLNRNVSSLVTSGSNKVIEVDERELDFRERQYKD